MTVQRWQVRTEPTTPKYRDGQLVVTVEPPATVAPGEITLDTETLGQRLVALQMFAWCFDLRGVSNPFHEDGALRVRLAFESDWYAAGKDPAKVEGSRVWPASRVWLERPFPPT